MKTLYERVLKWKEKYPEKRLAYNKVFVEVRAGRMRRQPCEICGEEETSAHHDDYNLPLKVRWLCKKCHTYFHVIKKSYKNCGRPRTELTLSELQQTGNF